MCLHQYSYAQFFAYNGECFSNYIVSNTAVYHQITNSCVCVCVCVCVCFKTLEGEREDIIRS